MQLGEAGAEGGRRRWRGGQAAGGEARGSQLREKKRMRTTRGREGRVRHQRSQLTCVLKLVCQRWAKKCVKRPSSGAEKGVGLRDTCGSLKQVGNVSMR